MVTKLYGTYARGSSDGKGTQVQFNLPDSLVIDSSGNFLVTDTEAGTGRIRKITPSGGTSLTIFDLWFYDSIWLLTHCFITIFLALTFVFPCDVFLTVVSTVAGLATSTTFSDGPALSQAVFNSPHGAAMDNIGNIFIADLYTHRIRRMSSTDRTFLSRVQMNLNKVTCISFESVDINYVFAEVTTLAGNGTNRYADGQGTTDAMFNMPGSLAFDARGNIIVVDQSSRIRMITPLNGASFIVLVATRM